MTFNARTATQAEFEAEARRTHQLLLDRIANLSPEEREACRKFGMPKLLHPELHLNRISSLDGLNQNIATCVIHYRTDLWQSSDEHTQALNSAHQRWPGQNHKQREYIEEQKQAFMQRLQSYANARARWVSQGNDPDLIDQKAPSSGRTSEQATEIAVSKETLTYARRMERRQRSTAGKKRWAEINRRLT